MGVWAERMTAKLARQQVWPAGRFKRVREHISLYAAFRESDRDRLKEDSEWTDADRYYQIDPVAPKISDAFASLLYGRRPEITAAAEKDQGRFDEIAQENGFPSKLQRGVRTASSEGESWWRILADPEASDVPLITWHSRKNVYPIFVGEKLVACGLISTYIEEDEQDRATAKVWRHFEIHEKGFVTNVLYEGAKGTLGKLAPLESIEATENLKEEWEHDLPMLAGRIPNTEGTDPTLGVSDYFRIKDILQDLNEALTIGAENARKTLKQRMIAPSSAFDEDDNVIDKDVWAAESLDDEVDLSGDTKGSPFRVLEFTFEAEKILSWRRGLAEDALGRVGIVAAFVGAGSPTEGLAQSGTALKVRLIPTTAAGEERGQYWDDLKTGLPGILALVAQVDALPQEQGGFGVTWADPITPPSVKRGSTLPEDEGEVIARNAEAVQGQIRSRRTAVEEQHPDWSPKEVDAELDRIREDVKDSQSLPGFLNDIPGHKTPEEIKADEEGGSGGDGSGSGQ